MSKCPSDMQIAMLIAGRASVALRRRLGEHLLVCDRCRRLFAEAVKDERETSLAPHAGEGPSEASVAPRDRALIEGVLEGISGTLGATVGCGPPRRIVPLQFRGGAGEPAVWAAKEATRRATGETSGGVTGEKFGEAAGGAIGETSGGPGEETIEEVDQAFETPVADCASADERYQVSFYRVRAGGGFRAVVRRPSGHGPMPARLAFPTLDLSFPVDAKGRTPVMTLEGILLESCRVDVEVHDPKTPADTPDDTAADTPADTPDD